MSQFKHISVEDFAQRPPESYVLVDIRDPQSFQNQHLPNAMHLSNDNLQEFINDTEFNETIVVYCYHGNSSQQAAQFLVEQGFEDVYNLVGGFAAWQSR